MLTLNKLGGKRWPRKGYVFTTAGKSPVSSFSRFKRRLDAEMTRLAGEPIEEWRLHDMRRTVATNLQRLAVRFEVTEAVLNHVSGSKSGVAGVYQRHDWATEKRDALNLWADSIKRMVDAETERIQRSIAEV